ncbi:50S ribosomal protein L4 [Candidatus Dependentiae bacterium]|nr:50S ribosomal protein L4 [Candidatus Dependentiae bacterium]
MKKDIAVWDIKGNKSQDIIAIDFEKKECDAKTYSYAIRKLLQNWRQGTVGCKNRSMVSFSNRKPWRQKGTGRARAGTLKSPLWRKGGIVFGPQPRIRNLDLNKKQLKSVLNNVFSDFVEESSKKIYCLDFDLTNENKPSTKKAYDAIKQLGIINKKILMFLPFEDEVNLTSFRNIPKINLAYFDQPNVFDLSNSDCLVFLKKDMNLFKDMVSLWN